MNNADDDEIDVNQCAYCWLYKVEVTNWLGRGIDLLGAFRTQLDTLYVHEGAWCVPGGGGYNIGIDYASSEVYVVNSISNRCNKVMVDRAAGAGSVVAYNFMDDGYIAGTPGWVEIGANASHLVGAHHVLFEGNKAFNWDSDSTHGSAIYMTSFRNQYGGIRESFTSNIDGITRTDSCHGSTTAPMRAIGAHIYTWWSSWLYNDLGTPGCALPANGWTLNGTQTSGHPVMYLLGADDEESNYAGDPNIQTIYPAVGPNCNASAPNCSSIISGNWLLGWTNTIAGTAWNTGNASGGITLSTTNTTNDTATMTLSSGPQLAYSNDIVTGLSNRVYFELKCIEPSTTDVKVGVTTTALSGGNYLGSNTSSLAFESGGTPVAGQMIWGGNGQGAFPPCIGGDTLGVALNLTSGQAFAHDYHAGAWSTNWNATAESQPTTGGYAFPSGLTGGVSMMISVDTTTVGNGSVLCTNASCGVNGGSGLPSGYSWWDSVANVGGGFSQSTPPRGPNSLFLSAKPSWWPSDFVWPPFTPDNATTPLQPGPAGCGGTCPGLPAAARWDNGTPFVNP
jgi:hypothetical protein